MDDWTKSFLYYMSNITETMQINSHSPKTAKIISKKTTSATKLKNN